MIIKQHMVKKLNVIFKGGELHFVMYLVRAFHISFFFTHEIGPFGMTRLFKSLL